jgi:homoserine kinase type II
VVCDIRDVVVPAAVIDAWQLDPDGLEAIAEGRNGRHWRATSPRGALALRRYGEDTEQGTALAEHRVLASLAACGVRAPSPVPASDGQLVIEAAGRRWAAFDWIAGDVPDRGDAAAAFATGVTLAGAHACLAPATSGAPGPSWGALIDFADTERWQGWTLRAALDPYAEHDRERAGALAHRLAQLDRRLTPFRHLGRGPVVIVHYDIHPHNVVIVDDQAAILDWGFAHPDARTTDLAIALRAWPEVFEALLAGYEREASPLMDDERAALPLLAAARGLDHVADRLTRWAAGIGPDPRNDVDAELVDLDVRLADGSAADEQVPSGDQ